MGYVSERSAVRVPRAGQRQPGGFPPRSRAISAHGEPEGRARFVGRTPPLARPGHRRHATRVASGLRVVRQPHHAQFVVYSAPDDLAMGFDCESRLTLGYSMCLRLLRQGLWRDLLHRRPPELSGGAAAVRARRLLEARRRGRSARTAPRARTQEPVPTPKAVRISADPTLVRAAQDFLASWLIRKDYDAAFTYVAPAAYACYYLERSQDQPAPSSPDDAGRKLRASLKPSGKRWRRRPRSKHTQPGGPGAYPSCHSRAGPSVRQGLQPVRPADALCGRRGLRCPRGRAADSSTPFRPNTARDTG